MKNNKLEDVFKSDLKKEIEIGFRINKAKDVLINDLIHEGYSELDIEKEYNLQKIRSVRRIKKLILPFIIINILAIIAYYVGLNYYIDELTKVKNITLIVAFLLFIVGLFYSVFGTEGKLSLGRILLFYFSRGGIDPLDGLSKEQLELFNDGVILILLGILISLISITL